MSLEDARFAHEDLERLEQAIADRFADEPRHIRDRLARDHQVASFLQRRQDQAQRLLRTYEDTEGRSREIQAISTGDPFEEFYKRYSAIKNHHRQYPNEPVENLERAYKRAAPTEGESTWAEIENLFTGEEAWGKFLDLTIQHEEYLNLPSIKRINYLQYLDNFDKLTPPFAPPKLEEKRKNEYFVYVGHVSSYLEDFMKRTRPLEDLNKLFNGITADFEKAWKEDEMPGWGSKAEKPTTGPAAPVTEGTGEGVWCAACAKEFKNDNVYKAHLTGKKHIKNAQNQQGEATAPPDQAKPNIAIRQLKDKAIAEREYRIQRLAAALSTVRADTRANVERKQGMTERERQQELEALFAETGGEPAYLNGADEESDAGSDTSEQIYNPLKLPLGWDGKPIPYWLYKLHGLGNEHKCEICGGYTYMGRRAYEKHFSEARHVQGLKMLGITNPSAFREITGIEDALNFWQKLQSDKVSEEGKKKDIVQMEDAEGNVMPEKVYYDLQKQGLL